MKKNNINNSFGTKKITTGLLMVSLLCAFTNMNKISAAPDCLDNSWHLEKQPDFKEYHLVSSGKEACNHDCYNDPRSRITNDRGYCTVCRHYRVPRPFIIVTSADQKAALSTSQKKQTTKKKEHILAKYCLQHGK